MTDTEGSLQNIYRRKIAILGWQNTWDPNKTDYAPAGS